MGVFLDELLRTGHFPWRKRSRDDQCWPLADSDSDSIQVQRRFAFQTFFTPTNLQNTQKFAAKRSCSSLNGHCGSHLSNVKWTWREQIMPPDTDLSEVPPGNGKNPQVSTICAEPPNFVRVCAFGIQAHTASFCLADWPCCLNTQRLITTSHQPCAPRCPPSKTAEHNGTRQLCLTNWTPRQKEPKSAEKF